MSTGKSEYDVDELIESLRTELPTRRDDERVRARLASAGLVVGTGVSAAQMATASAATAGPLAQVGGTATTATLAQGGVASLVAKLTGLSLTSKLAIGVAVVGVSAYPAGVWVGGGQSGSTAAPAVEAPSRPSSKVEGASGARPLRLQAPVAASAPANASPEFDESVVGRSNEALRATPPAARSTSAKPRTVVELSPTGKQPDESTPAVSSFPDVEQSRLDEEARLIEQALRARRAGDRAAAFRWLRLHQQRFPNGALAPERRRAIDALNQ